MTWVPGAACESSEPVRLIRINGKAISAIVQRDQPATRRRWATSISIM
jgi:hypothetical protein